MITPKQFKSILKNPWQYNLRKGLDKIEVVINKQYAKDLISFRIDESSNNTILQINYNLSDIPMFHIMNMLVNTHLNMTLASQSTNEHTKLNANITSDTNEFDTRITTSIIIVFTPK